MSSSVIRQVVRRMSVRDLGLVDSIDVMFTGDQHFGAPDRDSSYTKAILDWLESSERRYVALLGDLTNCGGRPLSKFSSWGEMKPKDAIECASRFLSKIGRERVICCIDGNHDQRMEHSANINPVAVACLKADIPFDGHEAFITIKLDHRFHRKSERESRIIYTMYATHGTGGGGKTQGAKYNMVQDKRAVFPMADIVAVGHVHKPGFDTGVSYEFSRKYGSVVRHNWINVIGAGGVSRHPDGYAVERGLPPVSSMIPVVRLDGGRYSMTPYMVAFEPRVG